MEHTSDTVSEGRLIHETSYSQRAEKFTEVEIMLAFTYRSPEGKGGNITLSAVIDFYDAKNKVIHETKKSDSMENAHEWQARFYIYLLEKQGVEGVTALLEYPKLRETKRVTLTEDDKKYLESLFPEIEAIVGSETCPPKIQKKFCKSCSYFEFCYASEDE
jgi:CRISPR-associated exonuclease Cas4